MDFFVAQLINYGDLQSDVRGKVSQTLCARFFWVANAFCVCTTFSQRPTHHPPLPMTCPKVPHELLGILTAMSCGRPHLTSRQHVPFGVLEASGKVELY